MKHDHVQFSIVQDVPNRMSSPPVLIFRPDQSYVSVARYEQEFKRHGRRTDPERLKLLFRLPSGDGYVQALEMRELDAIKGTAHLKRALEEAGLPASYARSPRHRVPVVMAQLDDDFFVSGAPANVGHESIFVQRMSLNSPSGTGSLINLRVHQLYRSHEALTTEQIAVLLLAGVECVAGDDSRSGARNASGPINHEIFIGDLE